MKLIDPTDEQLNAAFAQKVAGLADYQPTRRLLVEGKPLVLYCDTEFTTSADAVLPWLERTPTWNSRKNKDGLYIVGIEGPCSVGGVRLEGTAPTLAKAAVIALLRWHGADVRFPS